MALFQVIAYLGAFSAIYMMLARPSYHPITEFPDIWHGHTAVHQQGHGFPIKPAYMVWNESESDEENARKIHAVDAEDAAERWADEYDSAGDYTIVGGSEENVSVRSPDGKLTKFRVSGETVAKYSATEIES